MPTTAIASCCNMANMLDQIADLARSAASHPMQIISGRTAETFEQIKMLPILFLQTKELKFALAFLMLILFLSFYSLTSLMTPMVRFTLRKFGVEFGDIEISILQLSIIVNKIELSPLDMPILQIIFIALFPSANARSEKEALDYPWSKVKIDRLKVRLTIKARDKSNQTSWAKRAFHLRFPRPFFVVKMRSVVVEVEKAYIAPAPPADFDDDVSNQLPHAISMQQHPELLTFDQRYHVEEFRIAEIREADYITFCLERWIKYAVANMRNDSSDRQSDAQSSTSDDRLNSWISSLARILLQSVLFYIDSASVIISGAGSDIVKETRQRLPPNEVNLHLAQLRKEQRALTMISTSLIKISFSSDTMCNLLICFGGLQVKIGNPHTQQRARRSNISNNDSSSSVRRWKWYTIVQPFDAVAELKGVLPFIVYSLNYDHYWEERVLGLHLSVSSEISLTASPNNLHTLFLHLDDYLDTNSPFNQWFEWLKRCHQQTLNSSSTEKETYCRSYDRTNLGRAEVLSQAQMKVLKKKMRCSEIMTLRCISMRDRWRVPKESTEFEDYLARSRSEINSDIDDLAEESSSPFQRTYPSAPEALVTLVTEKSSIFAPKIELKCLVGTLNIHFPSDDEEALCVGRQQTIPSVLSVSSISFSVEQVHPLFAVDKNQAVDRRRQFVGLSVQANDLHWTVCDVDLAKNLRLPRFPDKSFVGIAYKSPQENHQNNVLDINMILSVTPTPQEDLHISVNLSSSDVTLIGNPLPLQSACQCLLDLSNFPFQEITKVSLGEDTVVKTESDNYEGTLSTTVTADIGRTSILFLVDVQEVSCGLLHFAINRVQMKSTSLGMAGEVLVSNEPFVLSAAQVTRNQPNSQGSCFDLTMLPFKPIITIIGAEIAIRAEIQQMDGLGPQQMELDVAMGVKSTEIKASPSTTAALIGASQSLITIVELENNTRDEEVSHEEKLQKDKMRSIQDQREALLKTFRIAGVTSVDILEEDDIEKLIHLNCDGQSNHAQHLTQTEIEREKDFVRLLAGESLTLDKINTMLFRFANGIDDSNFASTLQTAGVGCDGLPQCATFSSELSLYNLVYFDDLREYSSMHEVYRITGETKLYSTSRFPAPILWHRGQGVDLFWEFYNNECGCTRESLCDQDIKTVQQKLVRSLCNYEFAKFCWKTLVVGSLIHNHDIVETNWLLDDDPIQHIPSVFARLLKSINEDPKETEKTAQLSTYAISVSVVIDYAAMSLGSAQNFTKPLFEARSSKASLSLSAFLSQDGKFIDNCKDRKDTENSIAGNVAGNVLKFCSGDLDVSYLNTKTDNMEQLIEPYLCLGSVSYNILQQESDEEASLTIDLKCPQTLFMNISPVLFETTIITAKMISQADPKTYKKVLYERDKQYLHDICVANSRSQPNSLQREVATSELKQLVQSHWQEDFEGLSEVEIDKKITALMNATKVGDAMIRTSLLDNVLKNDARCFFSGCKKLLLSNSVGVSLTATAESDTRIIEAGSTVDFSLGKISLGIERYQIINDVPFSPYQPTMLKLARNSKHGRKTKRAACGFAPFLTVVPNNQQSLDAVKLTVRSSIRIKSEIPIRARIVRLPQKLGYLQKRNTKLVDLTKKNLAAALRRVAKGALIVHEMLISEGSVASVPLNIVLSTHYHALLFQDVSGEESDTWRDPVLLTKDFLFNEVKLREVSKCHTISGINIRKERLNVHSSAERRGKAITADSARSIWSTTAWDTTITVVPFFLLSNAMPFPILIKAWQYRASDENELWRDPAMFTDPISEHSNENESNSDGETSSKSPSLMGRSTSTEMYHLPTGSRGDNYYSLSSLESGKTLRLCGISLSCPLYIQFSQRLRGTLHEWSNVAHIKLQKLRTGINPNKGALSLKSLPIRLGDNVDCFIDAAVERGICRGALYSPFWICNQSGMKLEYRVIGTKDHHGISNKRYLDTGIGGLPIMLHCDNEGEKNAGKRKRKEISVIPLENPTKVVLGQWWDEQRNGGLVLAKHAVKGENNSVDWSEKIEMDAVGTSGEVHCSAVVFSVSVESMAGIFFRSNLIRFTPRFVVRNALHMPLSLVALSGTISEAIHKTRQLRHLLTNQDTKAKVDLAPGESTVIYSFNNTGGVGKSFRWISFRVNASRYDEDSTPKWHLVRLDKNGSTYLGEVDRRNVMVGIIDATVNRSSGSSLLCTISHAAVPPYRIENRSNTHHLRFAQYDDDGVVFELPPMHSCGYTWDNPHGKKRLRAEVIHKHKGGNDCRNDNSDSGSHAFSLHSRLFKINAGRKQNLQYSHDDCYFSTHSHVRISAGTKILSVSDSDFIATAVESGITSKDGGFENAICDIVAEGVSISIVDNFPKELLAITVRDVSISKHVGSIATQVLVRHFQIDAMDQEARYPIICQPLPFGIDHREPQSNDLTLPENVNSNDLFWMEHADDRPSPVFEANFKYVPQENMMWIPSLNVFLCPMKVAFDLDYMLRVASVFVGTITQYRDVASSSLTTDAVNTNDKLQYSSRGAKIVSLTYLERLTIAPVWFEVEICINDLGYDDGDGMASETALSLNSIAQFSNSSSIAGIVGWVVNVGSNFAHVTPCFQYPSVAYIDKFCDPIELVKDIMFFYVVQTIKQSLKVIFSNQFLGDPTLLALQLRTGLSDLVWRTRDEVRAGGNEGFGRGIASFSENAIGGTLFAVGKVAKSVAKTADACVSTELTSKYLKPRELDKRKRPRHAIDGFVQGTQFIGRELVHGTAGLIGSPYRGAKKGKVSSLAKGVATGVGGFVVSPFVAAFGFIAISSEGLGQTTKYLELSEIHARCRPSRVVPWGMPLSSTGLSFLKAIGIRIHTVRYQKIRKAVLLQDQDEGEGIDYVTSKEHKRIRAAEMRRTNPPSKVLRISYKKEDRRYTSSSINPKLLTDHPGNQTTSHYAAIFEQTLILRTNNLQLEDEVKIQFRNNKNGINTASSTLGMCKVRVGDIYSHVLKLHHNELMRKESRLSEEHVYSSDEITQNASTKGSSLIVPAPQEFTLMRPPKKLEDPVEDLFEAITNEMRDIERCEEEIKKTEIDSVYSYSSFPGDGKKKKENDTKSVVGKNERLFGSISLSFFPIQW